VRRPVARVVCRCGPVSPGVARCSPSARVAVFFSHSHAPFRSVCSLTPPVAAAQMRRRGASADSEDRERGGGPLAMSDVRESPSHSRHGGGPSTSDAVLDDKRRRQQEEQRARELELEAARRQAYAERKALQSKAREAAGGSISLGGEAMARLHSGL
jgi:hypothetical protein